MRRRLLIAALLLILVGILAAVWIGQDWPSPGLLVRHGLPPAGGPTGRRMTVEGIEFIEIAPGYLRSGSHEGCVPGGLLRRIGLPWGAAPHHDGRDCPPRWVEMEETFWIAVDEVSNAAFEAFRPDRVRTAWSPGDRERAVGVDPEDVTAYCTWLSKHRPDFAFRLPTRDEWEFAGHARSEAYRLHGALHLDQGRFLTLGFRPVATAAGPRSRRAFSHRFRPSRWEPVAGDRDWVLHAERALYSREGSESQLIQLAFENLSEKPVEIDLGDGRLAPAPNGWLPLVDLDVAGCLLAWRDRGYPAVGTRRVRSESLVHEIEPGGTFRFFRPFHGPARPACGEGDRFLLLCIGGQLGATTFLENGRRETVSSYLNAEILALPKPVERRPLPMDALVIER